MRKTILALVVNMALVYANSTNYKLATKCKEKGDYKCALKYTINQLNEDLKRYKRDSKQIAVDYNDVGYFSSILGNYDEALDYYFKALKINKKNFRKSASRSCN